MEPRQIRLIQKIIDQNGEITKLGLSGTMCKGLRPVKITQLEHLEKVKLRFNRILNLRAIKNRSLRSLKIVAPSSAEAIIDNIHLLWDQCPNLEHLTIEVMFPNEDLLQGIAGKSIKTLTLKNLFDGTGIPDNFFKGKKRLSLEQSSTKWSEHWLNHCQEENTEVHLRLLLSEKRDLTRLSNIRSLTRVIFNVLLTGDEEFAILIDMLRQMKLQNKIQFRINITIECSDMTRALCTNPKEQMQFDLKKWEDHCEHIKMSFM